MKTNQIGLFLFMIGIIALLPVQVLAKNIFFGSETETVYLYDWSSASYPYGNWIAVNTEFLPTTMSTSDITVTDFSRFVDFEGYVYMLVQTSGNDPTVTGHYDQINLGY